MAPDKVKIAKAEFEYKLEESICRSSSSFGFSPLYPVKKKIGYWRSCVDYRAQNTNTQPDRYPIPHLHDFSHQLEDCEYYFILDLHREYHQISMEGPEIGKKCNMYTIWFISNAALTFQRFIHTVLRSFDFCFSYIDDILVVSHNREEHLTHRQIIFEGLDEYSLTFKLSNCFFAKPEVVSLGHTLSSEGVRPTDKRVAAISNFERSKTIKQLRRFLRLINIYRRFIPHDAHN